MHLAEMPRSERGLLSGHGLDLRDEVARVHHAVADGGHELLEGDESVALVGLRLRGLEVQKVSYFVMLAGLYRKPSPLTCAPRAVPGDGGGEPAIDAVRGRRAWCPPWSCCTPGPSFGPWARRPGCPAGKFHPRPWPCLILLLGSRRK